MKTMITKLIDVLGKYANPQAFMYDNGEEARDVLKEFKEQNEKSTREEVRDTDKTGAEAHESVSFRLRN